MKNFRVYVFVKVLSALLAFVFNSELSAQSPPAISSLKVGFLAQVHAQTSQQPVTALQDADQNFNRKWQRQIYVRRLRIILGGNIAENTSFFFDVDAPNLGKVNASGVKDSKISMFVQDAQVQHTFAPELSAIAGLQLVGISRNSLQSSASLMALDFGSYQFITSSPLDNLTGRDLGLSLRGFLFNERFEYRSGVYSGRNTNQYSPLRFASRFQYNFRDIEKSFNYTGTTLGKGEIFSIGAGMDFQESYSAFAFDAMNDMPLGNLGSLTLSASISFLDGGGSDNDSTTFTGLIPKQSIIFFEAGYFFKDINIQPYVKYESQNVNASVLKQVGANSSSLYLQNKLKSSERIGFGLNYFINAHNVSVKLLYEVLLRNRISLIPSEYEKTNDSIITIQLQYFTF